MRAAGTTTRQRVAATARNKWAKGNQRRLAPARYARQGKWPESRAREGFFGEIVAVAQMPLVSYLSIQ